MKLNPQKIQRVLVIGLSCVGDMILATAALWNLRRFLPGAHFTILASPQAMQVLEGDPLWDTVAEYKRKKGFWGRIASAKMIRAIPHDLLIDLRSSAMPLVCGARYAPLWGFRELFMSKKTHEAERNLWCMQTIGVPVYSRRLRFYVAPAFREEAALLLEAAPQGPWALFNPGSNSMAKNWPPSHFIELARIFLNKTDFNIGFVGYSSYEQEIAAQICGEVSSCRCVDFSGVHPMGRLGALLERASLFVANDTGPLHVASAVGTPTVGFYRAENLPRFGPWCNIHRSLIPSPADNDLTMSGISVEEAWKACVEVLHASGSPKIAKNPVEKNVPVRNFT